MTENPLLEMRAVSKAFGATKALDGVSISVRAGEVRALVGENGAGKSTLMKVLSGAINPDSGDISLAGQPFTPRNTHHARQSGVAMIYQELSMAPHLTVTENIALGVEPTRFGLINGKRAKQSASNALKQMGHPEINPDTKVRNLSVADQQVVEIARALAFGCKVLVLDEPTSSLSREDVDRLFELIRTLRSQDYAIVYISHFLEEVLQIADTYTVLRDGQVVGEGLISGTTADDLVTQMIGRQVDQLYPKTERSPGEIVLHIENLSGKVKPVSASLDLRSGEVFGIAGLVGAGRTELFRSVFGLDVVKSGKIRVGAYAGQGSPASRWAHGVGMLSEDRKDEGLALTMSISDNITLSDLSGLGPVGLINPKIQAKKAGIWVKELDIRCRTPYQRVMELSGGNQQKVALARLLYHNVDVLLLDEPTRGIDVASKALIYEIIDGLVSPTNDKPRAVLVVSSYMSELLGICDRVAVMCKGHLGPARPVSELSEHDLMLEASGAGGS